MHVIAAKAVALGEALQPEFKVYAEQVIKNAKVLAAELIAKGLTIVSGGTDTHVMLVDVRNTGLTGKEAEHLLDEIGITANKNTIPFDPASPFVTSGVRLGTPAVTTRGLTVEDMDQVAECISLAIHDFDANADKIRSMVQAICEKHPLYE